MPLRRRSEYFESRVCSSSSDHFFRFIVDKFSLIVGGETVTYTLTEFRWTVFLVSFLK